MSRRVIAVIDWVSSASLKENVRLVQSASAAGKVLPREWRDTMGVTDPAKAAPGTMRKDFGESIGRNATHGSDAPETAAFELGYFFRGMELI